ncbi:unnamed protein product [Urochloa humidicola]
MAAVRSALARLGRRACGFSGSSATGSMGGRGLEVRKVVDPAAPRMPLLPSLRPASTRTTSLPLQPPSLPPAAVRNLQGWRCYSNESLKWADSKKMLLMKDRCERLLSTCSQLPRGKTVLEADHYLLALVLFSLTVSSGYVMTELWRLKLLPFSGPRTRIPDVDYDDCEDGDDGDD